MNFPSVRLEGSIVSADLLDAIAREDKPSQKPADFGLDSSTKVKDEIASTWASAKALWTGYQAKITTLREGQTGVSETRNLFVLPLLALLSYQPEKAEAEILNGKSYAVSHRDISRDGFPLHIMGWNDSLDKKRASGGPRISSHALVQEYLNLTEHLYALITNGRQLRLLRDSSRLIKLSFLEFDLVRIFEEDLYADFALLFRLLHATRMPANRASASTSIVERYHQDSVDSGSRIRDGLAAAVAYSMQTIANGLLSHPANGSLVQQLRDEPARANELHQNLLRWVYRALFVLVIEERFLHHARGTTLRQRQLYRDYYSLQRLRRLADRPQLADRRAHDLWRAMHQTLRLYEDGGKGLPLGIAPLGSFLFREEGLQTLFQYEVDNRSFLQALNRLSIFSHPDTNVRMRVNYGALDVEEFGSVYESLLELLPRVIPEGDKLIFSYAQLAGNERKTSGSYYTPDSLVQCLLDSALDPVIEERLVGKSGQEGETALLAIKLCDPAVGSGHFLIGAAHRLAQRLAEIRAGEEALSPDVQRRAMRDVVSHCLYGVDINPLAGELCKVSLWMLAMEPGKSLGFLDHHIRVGNSLLGTTPELIAKGIPDDAFKPIEGDDKKACTELKKLNARERRGFGDLFVREDESNLENLRQAALAVDELADDTPEALRQKEAAFAEAHRSYAYLRSRELANAWCAAFVIRKAFKPGTTDPIGITQSGLRKLAQGEHVNEELSSEIHRLARQYQFFHWHIEFPDVFDADGKGGFEVVLGNPPWEKVELIEKEWFASIRVDIARASTAAKRKKLIASLRDTDPPVFETYCRAVRSVDGVRHFIRDSARYPLCGVGRVNYYSAFAETSRALMSPHGRVGMLLPSGILTDDSTKEFAQDLLRRQQLVSFFDFDNRQALFPTVQGNVKFCAITLSADRNPSFEAAAQLGHPSDILNAGNRYTLTLEDVVNINPNTWNCPTFAKAVDAGLVQYIHARTPVVIRDGPPVVNPWQISFKQGLFNMTTDSHLFLAREDLERDGWLLSGNSFSHGDRVALPLYEAKLTSQDNHRAATFQDIAPDDRFRIHAGTNEPSLSQLRDPSYCVIPRYWVDSAFVRQACPDIAGWFVGFRNAISAVADARSLVATVIPYAGVGNSMPLLFFGGAKDVPSPFMGALNSFILDYVLRQKASGGNLNFYVFKQLPMPPPSSFATECSWDTRCSTFSWIHDRVLELAYTAWDLEVFAQDCGRPGPPFRWDEERRFLLRCELDAAYFYLYLGQEDEWRKHPESLTKPYRTPRDAVSYIMDTFPIAKRRDEEKYNGDYRTKRVILEIYDAMSDAIRTGVPYQTRLDPPPADPRCCHPPRHEALKTELV